MEFEVSEHIRDKVGRVSEDLRCGRQNGLHLFCELQKKSHQISILFDLETRLIRFDT